MATQVIPPAPAPGKRMTQKMKIMALMCRQPNKWFYPYEFMKPGLGALYVGYKAPTRIAELHHDNPALFETKKDDKYLQRKLNVAKFSIWYESLKPEIKDIVDQYYVVGDLPQ